MLPTDGDELLRSVFSQYFLGFYHSDGIDNIQDLIQRGIMDEELGNLAQIKNKEN